MTNYHNFVIDNPSRIQEIQETIHQIYKSIKTGQDYKEIITKQKKIGMFQNSPMTIDVLTNKFYQNYQIHTSGRSRRIEAPGPTLKTIQKTFLKEMYQLFPIHSAATAVPGKSFVDNAIAHKNSKCIFKTDIAKFYPSTNMNKVYEVISENYSQEALNWFLERISFFFYRNTNLLTVMEGSILPTGAPTSPIIGNIVLKPVDILITDFIKLFNGTYTRYLDDITVSFKEDLDNVSKNNIKNKITEILESNGWNPHPRKTKWINPNNDSYTVTGVDIRSKQKVTNKYIKTIIKPSIEKDIKSLFIESNHNTLNREGFFRSKSIDIDRLNFNQILPVILKESFHYLKYVEQVSKEQYNSLLSYTISRLNRIGFLRNLSPNEFTRYLIDQAVRQLKIGFIFQFSLPPEMPEINFKTYDEALLFSIKFLINQYRNFFSNRKLDNFINTCTHKN